MFAIKLLQSHPENFSNIQHHFTNDRKLLLFAIQKGYVPDLYDEIFYGDVELMRELSKFSPADNLMWIIAPDSIKKDSIVMDNLLSKNSFLFLLHYNEIIETTTLKNYIKKWNINELENSMAISWETDSLIKICSDFEFMSKLSDSKKMYLTKELRYKLDVMRLQKQ
jgi:hypothetical protein